jgi:cobalt-zinc-cadmium efflux system outer membrane protein
MLRVASIIVVMLLGTTAGCSSMPPTSVAGYRSEHREVSRTQVAKTQQRRSAVRSVAHVQAAEEIDASEVKSEPPESLSYQKSVTRSNAPLTLADLEGIALRKNPTLAAAAARMEAARGSQVQAGLYPNPVVGYHATEIGNVGTAGQQGGFISQRFITGGKLQLDQAIAGKEIDEAHFLFHAQQQRVLSDVRVRFYDALVAQRRLELTRKLASIGDDLVTATKTLLEGRLGTENDLLQAHIRADESRILHDNAGNENVEAWRRLAAVIGMPAMEMTPLDGDLDVNLDGELPSLDWDECYAMVMDSNRELNAAQTRVDRACIAIRRARKEPIPNIDLFVSVRHHNVTQDDVANVQVGIPIPVFNRNQGNIWAAEAKWAAACKEVKRLELDLQDRLAVAYRRYASARQQVERYSQRMVRRAEQSLELVTDGYEKGQVKYLTLLTAQQTYVQVNLSYLDSLRELRASSVVIAGQLLSGSLTKRQ